MPKQTASAAQFSSATNHQSVKWLQAVWLVGNEIGFTLQRTQHTELLFSFFFFKWDPGHVAGVAGEVRSHLWTRLWLRDRRGRRAVHGSEEIWERSACLLVSEVVRGGELSGTPVSRVNKVHLFIPSSFVRCQRLKTGLSKNTATLISACVCLAVFSHAYEHKHTHKQRESGAKCV